MPLVVGTHFKGIQFGIEPKTEKIGPIGIAAAGKMQLHDEQRHLQAHFDSWLFSDIFKVASIDFLEFFLKNHMKNEIAIAIAASNPIIENTRKEPEIRSILFNDSASPPTGVTICDRYLAKAHTSKAGAATKQSNINEKRTYCHRFIFDFLHTDRVYQNSIPHPLRNLALEAGLSTAL